MRSTPEGGPLDVIVVGAGPVGLCTALGLARAGRRVLVLEKEPGIAEHSRAPAIWPRTQEILADLGVVERFRAEGIALETVRLRDADAGDGRALISIPVRDLSDETRFPALLILPQSETERLLCEAVRSAPGVELLFSAEVTGVEQEEDRVTVHYTCDGGRRSVAAAFAVGADGARSRVREAIGSDFPGETYAMRAALADLRFPGTIDLPFPRLSTADGLAVAIRIRSDLWRLILPFAGDDDRPLEERVERAAIRLFPSVTSAGDYSTVWQSEFRLHRRLASRFVAGRVALAGDAAHLNSPVGGQGMNAGIHDGAALVDALVRALDTGEMEPLARYERVRREAVGRGVNRFTDLLTRGLLLRRGGLVKPALAVGRLMMKVPPLRRRFLRRLAMLD